MHDPRECHKRAEALATLAMMFPENADRYRVKEQYWRGLEAEARSKADTVAEASTTGVIG
jgi:hypothetical protein